MSSGFNTDVRVGDRVFHVQTEDRGPSHPCIDTAIYQQGRVVHRHSTNYEHLTLSVELNDEALHRRVADQHKFIIDELRAGALDAQIDAATKQSQAQPHGQTNAEEIVVQLLNPKAWLSAGKVLLDVEIVRKSDQKPQSGAHVEALIEGSLRDGQHVATSDEQGRVRIEFPLPQLGKGDLALVVRAKKDAAKHEIRFSMRSRQAKNSANTAKS